MVHSKRSSNQHRVPPFDNIINDFFQRTFYILVCETLNSLIGECLASVWRVFGECLASVAPFVLYWIHLCSIGSIGFIDKYASCMCLYDKHIYFIHINNG